MKILLLSLKSKQNSISISISSRVIEIDGPFHVLLHKTQHYNNVRTKNKSGCEIDYSNFDKSHIPTCIFQNIFYFVGSEDIKSFYF